jgi:hypothetical protein
VFIAHEHDGLSGGHFQNGYASIREFTTSPTVIGALKVARFFPAHSRCMTETIANCSCLRP